MHTSIYFTRQYNDFHFLIKNADDYLVKMLSDLTSSIKHNVILSYVYANQSISKQIEQAILYLAQKEFPHRWSDLTNELMQYIDIELQNNEQTRKVLKLLHKITNRYSYEMRSDELYTEIILVCDTCHDPLYKLT